MRSAAIAAEVSAPSTWREIAAVITVTLVAAGALLAAAATDEEHGGLVAVALMIFYVAGRYTSVTSLRRHRQRELTSTMTLPRGHPNTCRFEEAGFTVANPLFNIAYQWAIFTRASIQGRFLVLSLVSGVSVAIPVRAFVSEEAAREALAFSLARIERNAATD